MRWTAKINHLTPEELLACAQETTPALMERTQQCVEFRVWSCPAYQEPALTPAIGAARCPSNPMWRLISR